MTDGERVALAARFLRRLIADKPALGHTTDCPCPGCGAERTMLAMGYREEATNAAH